MMVFFLCYVVIFFLFILFFNFVLLYGLKNFKFFYILFIFVDDFGWSDVGFYGLVIKMLNIDKLVNEGVILDNYYVLLLCILIRLVLMIGRYFIYIGIDYYGKN